MTFSRSLLLLGMALFSARGFAAHAADDCASISPDPSTVKEFYEDNPTYQAPAGDAADWPIAAATRERIDTDKLDEGAAALEKLPQPLSLLVARHGNLVYERYFHGSSRTDSNNVHSASKSLLSGLIGIAMRDGYFDGVHEKIAQVLTSKFALSGDKADYQLQHLLTMTSGFRWTEDDSEYKLQEKKSWVQGILDLPQKKKPGQWFNYATANTHLLSAILTEATGENTCSFATRNVFRPLGITVEHWGRDPQGYYSGGYNVYLTARALARIGQTYLQNGEWNGREVFPPEWVRQAHDAQTKVDDTYDYGYLWWLLTIDGHRVYKMWGYGGQLVFLVPDLDLLVTTTADTKQDYTELDGDKFLQTYVLPAVRSFR